MTASRTIQKYESDPSGLQCKDKQRNNIQNGDEIIEFATKEDLRVTDTFFAS